MAKEDCFAGDRPVPTKTPVGEAADTLNAAIEHAEDLFADRFTAPAEIPLLGNLSCPGEKLRFAKVPGGGFGFCIIRGNSPNDNPIPIEQTSIDTRIRAANKLISLWEACEEAEGETLQKLQAATEFTNVFVSLHTP